MQLVDAHHHLWCPQSDPCDIGYVWLRNIGALKPFGDPTQIQRDYLIDEYLAESADHEIIASIHVQADGAIPNPVNETRWIEHVTTGSQHPCAQVGFIDLCCCNAQHILDQFAQISGLKGVRQILSRIEERPELCFAPEHYLHNDQWRDRFGLLNEQNFSFDLQCYPQQMVDAADLLSLYPGVDVVIDHAGSPYDQSDKGLSQWHEGLKLLAQLPQCHIKLSGFGMFDRHWCSQSIQPMFEKIIELFTPGRVMFGSNFPVDKLMHDYDYAVKQLRSCCDSLGLSQQEADDIFMHTARRFYRLG